VKNSAASERAAQYGRFIVFAKRLSSLLVLAAFVAALASVATTAEAASRGKTLRLKAFRTCSGLINYGNRYAPKSAVPLYRNTKPINPEFTGGGGESGGGSTGGPTSGGGSDGGGAPTSTQSPAAAPAPAADSPQKGTDFSGTNNQEETVDEPDIVKTNGDTVFAVSQGKLFAVDVRNGEAKLAGSLDLPTAGYQAEILISGKRLLLMYTEGGGYYYGDVAPAGGGPTPAVGAPRTSLAPGGVREDTMLAEVDISDPSAMKVTRSMTVDGRLVSSRLNGSTARVITAASPRALEVPIEVSDPPADQQRALQSAGSKRANKWMPRKVTRRGFKGRAKGRAATACRAVRRPAVFSGLDMVTILTIDLDKGLTPVDSDALMTDAETVYASENSLYIATRKWLKAIDSPIPNGSIPEPPSIRTQIHKFDISDSQNTTYKGSGDVSGYLLNQFSLSENKGTLRVASTDEPTWWPGATSNTSSSSVTTLGQASEGLLATVGRVGGLGKGERIYAVRFIGDTGYVVTFRQTDPLYTVDVSDPAKPKVVGELKIDGYSAYLHPVTEDLIIGVGQDATPEGRRTGAQVSLFDVSDPANPKRLQQHSLGKYASTQAEYDHHAFLYWPQTNLLVLPVNYYNESDSFSGALGMSVKETSIDDLGSIEHPRENGYSPSITRSLVIGDRVFTLSDTGLQANSIDKLANLSFTRFRGGSSG
jgi:hypothetical protein